MQTEQFASLTIDEIRRSNKPTREEYIHLFNKAVSKRLKVAKKPIFSLSGGLDSSSVVSMAQQITQKKQTAISTVHPNKLYDEQEEILDVIQAGKVNWNSVTITNPNIFEKLTNIYSSHDYPLPTVTWLNHLLLVEEAAKLGFKNCLFPKANERNKNWKNIVKSIPEINFHAVSHVRDVGKFFRK